MLRESQLKQCAALYQWPGGAAACRRTILAAGTRVRVHERPSDAVVLR
jgi:hypothetical protein